MTLNLCWHRINAQTHEECAWKFPYIPILLPVQCRPEAMQAQACQDAPNIVLGSKHTVQSIFDSRPCMLGHNKYRVGCSASHVAAESPSGRYSD